MRWFFFGVAPALALVGSLGLVIFGLALGEWGRVAIGGITLVAALAYLRKLPDFEARDNACREAGANANEGNSRP